MINQKEEWGNIELPGLSDEELFAKRWNCVAAGKARAEDPAWQAIMQSEEYKNKIKQAMKEKRTEGSEWKQNHKKAVGKVNRERAKEPIWQERSKRAGETRSADPKWRENMLAAAEKRGKPIQTPEGIFPTRSAAIKHFNKHFNYTKDKIARLLKINPTEWYYIEKEQE